VPWRARGGLLRSSSWFSERHTGRSIRLTSGLGGFCNDRPGDLPNRTDFPAVVVRAGASRGPAGGWVASHFFRPRASSGPLIGVGVAVCLALGVGAALCSKQWWCCSLPSLGPADRVRSALAPARCRGYTTYRGRWQCRTPPRWPGSRGSLAIAGLLGACVALLARIDRAAQDLLGSRSGARGRAKTAPLFHHWV
jgi:hypothetical protein